MQQNVLDRRLVGAVFTHREKDVRTLLRRGADPNADALRGYDLSDLWTVLFHLQRDEDGVEVKKPVLIYVTATNQTTIARLLIEQGAEVNCHDAYEETPLINASENGLFEIVDLLLRKGAKADCHNYEGQSALSLAKTPAIAQRLREAGAKE
jgi:hypothetical protein